MLMFNAMTAWSAGIFEGEGTLVRGHADAVIICISMTDLDILERLQVLHGGIVLGPYANPDRNHPSRPRKPRYRWQLKASLAEPLLSEWFPLLGQRRREQVKSFLASRETCSKNSTSKED